MARQARIVIPGAPHHVTQRGNHRAPIFFRDDDYRLYRRLLAERCAREGVAVWAYCLMPNHVHLILVPSDDGGLARAVGAAHTRYAGLINSRLEWTGHLFQNRFASVPMDERHLLMAVRYVSLNPVRAKLVERAEDWKWSSAWSHLNGRGDGTVDVGPVLERVGSFAELLGREDDDGFARLRAAEISGRPVGDQAFIAELEARLGVKLKTRPLGRPRREALAPVSA